MCSFVSYLPEKRSFAREILIIIYRSKNWPWEASNILVWKNKAIRGQTSSEAGMHPSLCVILYLRRNLRCIIYFQRNSAYCGLIMSYMKKNAPKITEINKCKATFSLALYLELQTFSHLFKGLQPSILRTPSLERISVHKTVTWDHNAGDTFPAGISKCDLCGISWSKQRESEMTLCARTRMLLWFPHEHRVTWGKVWQIKWLRRLIKMGICLWDHDTSLIGCSKEKQAVNIMALSRCVVCQDTHLGSIVLRDSCSVP